MSWKKYAKQEIIKFEDDMDKQYPELHTILKRHDNFGVFYESVEKILKKDIDALSENSEDNYMTEDMYVSFLYSLDEAFAEWLEETR